MHLSTLTQLADYVDPNMMTTTTSTDLPPGVLAAIVIFALLVVVAVYAVYAVLLGRIFKKANVKSWKAWVPFYNNWILLELGEQQGFWAIFAFIPVINIVSAVFMYIAMYHIGLKLKKDGVFVLWAIFIPLVWYIWLAVDNSTWDDTRKDETVTPTATA